MVFWRLFSFSQQVRYVNSLEGIYIYIYTLYRFIHQTWISWIPSRLSRGVSRDCTKSQSWRRSDRGEKRWWMRIKWKRITCLVGRHRLFWPLILAIPGTFCFLKYKVEVWFHGIDVANICKNQSVWSSHLYRRQQLASSWLHWHLGWFSRP